MKLVTTFLAVAAICSSAAFATMTPEVRATHQDIKQTLGVVPSFIKAYPDAGLPAAWEEMKSVQLSSTTMLPGKVKELIGLGVSAQIPCKFCVYFHTEAAKLNGATDQEVSEALAMAAATRHWSTFLNGMQTDDSDFRNEANKVFSFVKEKMTAKTEPTKAEAPINVTDATTAYQDIERTLGSVPTFLRQFPEAGISGAWKMMKTVQLNPGTALTGKTKELIGLAVSAQVPCKYCTYFHTEAAKQLSGATEQEVREAVAMASITRFWSTILNGSQTNETAFKKEVAQILKHVKAQSAQHDKMGAGSKTVVKRSKK